MLKAIFNRQSRGPGSPPAADSSSSPSPTATTATALSTFETLPPPPFPGNEKKKGKDLRIRILNNPDGALFGPRNLPLFYGTLERPSVCQVMVTFETEKDCPGHGLELLLRISSGSRVELRRTNDRVNLNSEQVYKSLRWNIPLDPTSTVPTTTTTTTPHQRSTVIRKGIYTKIVQFTIDPLFPSSMDHPKGWVRYKLQANQTKWGSFLGRPLAALSTELEIWVLNSIVPKPLTALQEMHQFGIHQGLQRGQGHHGQEESDMYGDMDGEVDGTAAAPPRFSALTPPSPPPPTLTSFEASMETTAPSLESLLSSDGLVSSTLPRPLLPLPLLHRGGGEDVSTAGNVSSPAYVTLSPSLPITTATTPTTTNNNSNHNNSNNNSDPQPTSALKTISTLFKKKSFPIQLDIHASDPISHTLGIGQVMPITIKLGPFQTSSRYGGENFVVVGAVVFTLRETLVFKDKDYPRTQSESRNVMNTALMEGWPSPSSSSSSSSSGNNAATGNGTGAGTVHQGNGIAVEGSGGMSERNITAEERVSEQGNRGTDGSSFSTCQEDTWERRVHLTLPSLMAMRPSLKTKYVDVVHTLVLAIKIRAQSEKVRQADECRVEVELDIVVPRPPTRLEPFAGLPPPVIDNQGQTADEDLPAYGSY